MQKTKDMPLWVFLAFSSINSRKAAMWLIGACIIFGIYCIPWSNYFKTSAWIAKVFLIDDWSWVAMMVPITIWYWLSLKWIDNHSGWADTGAKEIGANANGG